MDRKYDDDNFAQYKVQAARAHRLAETDPIYSLAGENLCDNPERDLRVIFMRISDAIGLAEKTRGALDEIADRVLGPLLSANEAGIAKGLASGGVGDIAQINSQLDMLFNVLQSQVDAVRRLENL